MTLNWSLRAGASTALLVLTSACGGGGGGSTAGEQSLANVPIDQDGRINTLAPADVTLSGARSDPDTVTVTIEGLTLSYDPLGGDTVEPSGSFVFFEKAGDFAEGLADTRQASVVNIRMRTEQGDIVSIFDGGALFVGVDGERSTSGPATPVLRYEGEAIGYAVSPTPQVFDLVTDVTIEVNFDTGGGTFTSQNGVISSPRAGTGSTSAANLSGDIIVSGGAFSGDLTGTSSATTTGTVNGAFFGPESGEAGGTFDYSNPTGFYGILSFSATGAPVVIPPP